MANQFLNSALTSLFAVVVFVVGQIIVRLFIDPIQKQTEIIGNIAHSITFYANVFGASVDDHESIMAHRAKEAEELFRKQAAHLIASTATIRWYWLWESLHFIPKRENAIEASTYLIGLSNSIYGPEINWASISDRKKKIKELLDFDF